MKLNCLTQTMLGMGMLCAAIPAFALEAWNGQEGSTTYDVIFNGGVYKNAWWVGSNQCPGAVAGDEANNPWRYQRSATAAEIKQYGNPTSCEVSGGGSDGSTAADTFQAATAYSADAIVSYNGLSYKTASAVSAYSFVPGADNPWKQYEAVKNWSSSATYYAGDIVQKNGQQYQALFFTQGDDPSLAANQNPTSSNGRPWLPMGAVVSYTQAQLNAAPNFSANTLYASGTLIRFNGVNYVSQSKVQKVSPSDINPWKIYYDWTGTKERVGTPQNPWPEHVYAPYVDFSLGEIPDLAALAKNQGINHFTIAFVVNKDPNTCMPTWGTYYSLKDYAQYSKIKALREAGGDVMVSIGGASNSPLAAACKDVGELTQQYYDIVENLNLNVLDFDIEGTWVADQGSIERRNQAVKAVQDKWKQEGRKVGIWYTLPIMPEGLKPEGLNVLRDAVAKGVELAGVNVMTMDYGSAKCQSTGTEGQNIHGRCATSAIESLSQQLKQIFTDKTDAQINAMIGTTPMIGRNDVGGETFYLSDAKMVMSDAQQRDLGMIGIWSMARDKPGQQDTADATHSGLSSSQASQYAFSQVFAPFTHADASTDDGSDTGVVDSGFLGYSTSSYANGSTKNIMYTNLSLKLDAAHQAGNYEYKLSLNGKQICSSVNGNVTGGSRSVNGDVATVTCNLGAAKEGDNLKLTVNGDVAFDTTFVGDERTTTDATLLNASISGAKVTFRFAVSDSAQYVLYQDNVYRGNWNQKGGNPYMNRSNNKDNTVTYSRNLPNLKAGNRVKLVRNGNEVVFAETVK